MVSTRPGPWESFTASPWEVYGMNENGRQAEAYFHPVTLEHIMTTQR